MNIKVKNFKTVVTVNKSVEMIEKLLLQAGASHITKKYAPAAMPGNEHVEAIYFQLHAFNMNMPVRIMPDITNAFLWTKKQNKSWDDKKVLEQAARFAWKTQYELLHIQLSLAAMEQKDLLRIFLPDIVHDAAGNTFYDTIKQGGFKGLLPPSM